MKVRVLVTVVALVGLTLGGCKKDEAAAESEGGASAQNTGVPEKTLEDLFDTDKPALFGPFAKLKFGASIEEVSAAFPKWFEEPDRYGRQLLGRGDLEAYLGELRGSIQLRGGLNMVRVELPKARALELLEARWGEPQSVKLGRVDVHLWFDADTGVRGVLKPTYSDDTVELEVEQYMGYDAVAEASTDQLSFKPGDVLGKTGAELLKAFPQYISTKDTESSGAKAADKMMKGLEDDLKAPGAEVQIGLGTDLHVSLPPTLYDGGDTLVVLHFDDGGRVRSYTMKVEFGGRAESGDDLARAFTSGWGEPKTLDKVLGEQPFWYDAGNGLRVSGRFRDEEVDLGFTTYMPLDAFFGEGTQKWGFESTTVLGASVEELQKAYGASCRIKDNKKFGSLHLEKTSYQDNVGRTLVHLVFDDDQKVKSYSFSLRYKDYPPAKEEFLSRLKAKYGDPRPAPKDFLKRQLYSADPRVLVRDSDITNALDVSIEKKE